MAKEAEIGGKAVAKTAAELVAIVLQAVNDKDTKNPRLELVERLLVENYKRGTIVRIVSEAFGVAIKTVDRDIQEAKERFVDYARRKGHDNVIGEAMARARNLHNRAVKRGDLQVELGAAKHISELEGAVKKDDETPNVPGIVLVPALMGLEEWKSKFSPKK